MPDGMLVTKGVTKSYGDLVALVPLDLTIDRGEVVALVGHNGSGKSTFLRLAAGTLELTDGSIEIAGRRVAGPADSIGIVFQNHVLLAWRTVLENIMLQIEVRKLPRGRGLEHARELVDMVGLKGFEQLGLLPRADDLPARFSRGLRQRTSLAIGIVRPFDLLLVDEPFVGLDASGKAALLDLIDQFHDEGRTVVVATHDAQFVERVGRCIALRDGEVVHDGTATRQDVLRLVGA